MLNRPLEAAKSDGGGTLPSRYSLIECDCENIVIETIKKAEADDAIIVRLYDAWNRKSSPNFKLGFKAKKIELCDMIENPIEKVGSGSEFKIDVRNFEIVTLKLSK